MLVGDLIEYNNIKLRVEKEKSNLSCAGCFLNVSCSQGRTGCLAKSTDHIFDNCKKEHVIFVKI